MNPLDAVSHDDERVLGLLAREYAGGAVDELWAWLHLENRFRAGDLTLLPQRIPTL